MFPPSNPIIPLVCPQTIKSCSLSTGLKKLATSIWPYSTSHACVSLPTSALPSAKRMTSQYFFTFPFMSSVFHLDMPAHFNWWNPNSPSRTISYITLFPNSLKYRSSLPTLNTQTGPYYMTCVVILLCGNVLRTQIAIPSICKPCILKCSPWYILYTQEKFY